MKKKKWIINISVVLLLLLGIALIFNSQIRDSVTMDNTNKYQIPNVSKKQIAENKKADTSFDFDKVEPLSTSKVLSSQTDKQPLPVIGGIAIPSLNINLPIFKGVGNVSLMYGAGTMKSDQVMGEGNYALASHTSSGFAGINQGNLFTPLENAKKGMSIYITDKTKVYEYVISNVSVVDQSQGDVILDQKDKKLITLVTCETRSSNNRIIVQGTLKGSTDFDKTSQNVLSAFDKKYNVFYKPFG